MNIRATLFVTTLALTATSARAIMFADESFDRTLNVSGSPSVTVSTGSGHIHLSPGSDSQIHIVAHLHANIGGWFSGPDDAEARIRRIIQEPPVRQNGNDVQIGERNHNDLYRNITIDYDISLPRASKIIAASGSGDVQINDVGSALKAETGSGSIQAHGIHGVADLETGSGTISLLQTSPGDVRAQTGSGSIHLDGISGALKADTGSGSIEVAGKPTSDWKLETGSGSIHLNLASAHFNVDASTGSGGIHVEQSIASSTTNHHHVVGAVNGGGPLVRASTGSGGIEIR